MKVACPNTQKTVNNLFEGSKKWNCRFCGQVHEVPKLSEGVTTGTNSSKSLQIPEVRPDNSPITTVSSNPSNPEQPNPSKPDEEKNTHARKPRWRDYEIH